MHDYSDVSERKLIVKFFSSIGFCATFAMACIALVNTTYILSSTLFLSAFIYAWAFRINNNVENSASAILYNLYALMIYLVVTGGVQGTGPIWIFIVSPVTFSIRGFRRGIIDIVLFLLAVTLAFYLAQTLNIYHYQPSGLPYRILLSFIIVAMLSGYYEYSRNKYNHKIITLSKKNEYLATIDPLTGLPNRRFIISQLETFKRALCYDETPFVIVLCDVDNFKKINDEYGHGVGDNALVYLADLLKKSLPNDALASRWGGEEFLVAMPNASTKDALEVANTIHTNLSNYPLKTEFGDINMTISIGVVQANEKQTIDLDIKRADELLYKAKEQGKNITCSE